LSKDVAVLCKVVCLLRFNENHCEVLTFPTDSMCLGAVSVFAMCSLGSYYKWLSKSPNIQLHHIQKKIIFKIINNSQAENEKTHTFLKLVKRNHWIQMHVFKAKWFVYISLADTDCQVQMHLCSLFVSAQSNEAMLKIEFSIFFIF
jgi:hypothetical protein